MKNNDLTTKPMLPLSANQETIRLNKWISHAGICSRRDADALISSGKITVNGQKITTLGYQITYQDEVRLGEKVLSLNKPIYLLFNKPRNCITTTLDPEGRRTVMDYVCDACNERIYPVGRLDRNTTGLLLLTNDGALAQKLAHPSHQVTKMYQVDLAYPLRDNEVEKMLNGIKLSDGIVKVDELSFLGDDKSKVGIKLHSGKNRVIRRIFEKLGNPIITLDRVMYANLTKYNLPRGEWRFLTHQEINYLKKHDVCLKPLSEDQLST